jgi:hypothetical protein
VHAKPSKWLHEIYISKTVRAHFSLVLMARAEIWGHNYFPISPILGHDCNLNSSGSMGKKHLMVALPKTLPTTTEVL